jgi:hypothetical protein
LSVKFEAMLKFLLDQNWNDEWIKLCKSSWRGLET